MISAESCALITLDQEGRPRVRAMDPFDPDDDFAVWLGTNSNSRKVDQIKNDPRVTLYYLEENDAGYVMIYGTAYLVDDKEDKEKRWKPEWEAFYPGDREGYLLIKIIPEWMEVVSYTYGFLGDPENWEPPKVIFDSKEQFIKKVLSFVISFWEFGAYFGPFGGVYAEQSEVLRTGFGTWSLIDRGPSASVAEAG